MGISRELWLKAWEEAAEAEAEVMTREQDLSGIVTTREFAEAAGCAETTARHRLGTMERAGKVERTTRWKKRPDGSVVKIPAWRLLGVTSDGRPGG